MWHRQVGDGGTAMGQERALEKRRSMILTSPFLTLDVATPNVWLTFASGHKKTLENYRHWTFGDLKGP